MRTTNQEKATSSSKLRRLWTFVSLWGFLGLLGGYVSSVGCGGALPEPAKELVILEGSTGHEKTDASTTELPLPPDSLPEPRPEPPKDAPLAEKAQEPAIPESSKDATPETPVDPPSPEAEPTPERTNEPLPEATPEATGPHWIGEPCTKDSDCAYQGGRCLPATQGFPNGMCTQTCSRLCPDLAGKTETFCLDLGSFPPHTGGGCVSQCDFPRYPQTGCRAGYRCENRGRFNESTVQRSVCVPGTPQGPQTCYQKAAALGLQFAVRSNPKDRPDGFPNLVCDVVDALSLSPPIHGVQWVTGSNVASPMFMRCELALAMSAFSKYLLSRGITKVMHYGTYNCRTIRNDSGSTSTLSEHGLGHAIDLAAFWDNQGTEYSLVKHWDHSTSYRDSRGAMGCPSTTFNSPQAKVLYEIGCQMWKQKIFTLVLTPNYNQVHDNHFHVDFSSSGIYTPLLQSRIGPRQGHGPSCEH